MPEQPWPLVKPYHYPMFEAMLLKLGMGPRWNHPCADCKYLGVFGPLDIYKQCGYSDHDPRYLLRYGEGNQYASALTIDQAVYCIWANGEFKHGYALAE